MRILPLAILLAFIGASLGSAEDGEAHTPKLLLSSKLIKRLTRDHERQTPRWINFENRIKNVTDSPERGFELSLYYVVTHDVGFAHDAITWGLAHSAERRQRAIILDWCGELASVQEKTALTSSRASGPDSKTFQSRRDCLFENVAAGRDMAVCQAGDLQTRNLVSDAAELYAACEYFITTRMNGAEDQRRQNPKFFQHLPVEFLLARRPQDVDKPDWLSHVAALALVTLDPNLEASQFLQGWAIEDRQTLHEGPGVAYELLWADPYLPGIAYQNLDPWLYEEEGARLFARSDWTLQACWVEISASGLKQQGCQDGWQQQTAQFGSLKLMPVLTKCSDIPHQDLRDSVMIWKLKPGEKISYRDLAKEITIQADEAGMWHPGTNVEGRICTVR